MLDVHLETVEKLLVYFIRDTVYKNNFKNGIVGVSGGVDSAVVLALTQQALGSEHTFALLMPYKLSSKDSLKDGKAMCEQMNVDYEIVDISPSVDAYFERFPTDNKMLIGNKCARERMSVLYDFSARKQALVVGTSNKSELLVGYSTLFGDSAAAFLPLGDLYKTQIFTLARYLDIPDNIVNKKPTADLWKDQTDEGEIGITYKELDEILYQMIDCRKKDGEIEAMGYSLANIKKIKKMITNSQYKRTMPPVCKLHARTIGMDFRYLRDWSK
ncbi:MAG: NAD+ synthase [Candidatus Aminicenantes bacterium]|nr:NAD+ synthase [Candidatus Aminicenantes bacterium]NIM78176.1 NAD+ synthase [Candidatus Aminicenantes bacterium]NIN17512.1 NAD+ synthase [Candidatus Aminicenantes bacterium]NIN41398.1 NAD+ synthase [Candidatus Aminicenantes bacterium]NIN84164.1 NAD+ synthase [Candidatus Aminicenantes bacterium]